MTPVVIIGDLHIGARNNSQLFLDYMKDYFYNELFPFIKENNVKNVIQLGDTLDKRKNIDFKTAMSAYYTSFLSRLIEQGSYGIQYLDSELLTDELEKELTKDF